MRTMTIHRALAELKTLDARIAKAIDDIDPVGIRQAEKPVLSALGKVYENATTFEQLAQGGLQSIDDLIKTKTQIKRAIVESNSRTMVTIADRTMTVAEAITEKSFITLKKKMVDRLTALERKNQGSYKTATEKMEKNLQILLEATFAKEQVKASAEDIDNIRKPFMKANEVKLVDPLGVDTLIQQRSQDIAKFEADVDACLSEINAVTTITID
jgi:hypothetical protein